jgi:hypothetical protein
LPQTSKYLRKLAGYFLGCWALRRLEFASGWGRSRYSDFWSTSVPRQLFEQRNTGSLNKQSLDQLRDEFEEFRSHDYEALYRQWQLQGDGAVEAAQLSTKEPLALFDTYRLDYDHSFFGQITRGYQPATATA